MIRDSRSILPLFTYDSQARKSELVQAYVFSPSLHCYTIRGRDATVGTDEGDLRSIIRIEALVRTP